MEAIAVISDIHSNSPALTAVLEDIKSRKIDRIVNLGDTLYGPVDPLGTAALLMDKPHVINIMGNCDQALLATAGDAATYQFVKPLLTQAVIKWLATFQFTWVYNELLFCHGTPFRNDRYLLEEVTEHGVRIKHTGQLLMELETVPQSWIFCGHSHVPRTICLPDGKTVVNAGSVGLPAYDDELPYPHVMESHTPFADYAVVYRSGAHWALEHIMLPYDWEKASALALANGRKDYAHAIRTGRAL